MTHRVATNCAKNYCNRTPIVKVIVKKCSHVFFGDTVYFVTVAIACFRPIAFVLYLVIQHFRCQCAIKIQFSSYSM